MLRDRFDRLFVSDDGSSVGMMLIKGSHRLEEEPSGRIILAHTNLLQNDLSLPLQLGGVKGRVLNRITQNIKARVDIATGEGGVIDCLVIRSVSVDIPPQGLNLLCHFPNLSLFGP